MSSKYIKFGLQLDFHTKNILTGWINNFNFEYGEMVHSTRVSVLRVTIYPYSINHM
jgi:hypothetical protein